MSYKQPRVPEWREGMGMGAFVKALILFLKDFCMAAWAANNRRQKEIKALEERLKRLEGE